jgi:hypothetical protein
MVRRHKPETIQGVFHAVCSTVLTLQTFSSAVLLFTPGAYAGLTHRSRCSRRYCQLCEKACRDENGYKCHTQSESHLRQVPIAARLRQPLLLLCRGAASPNAAQAALRRSRQPPPSSRVQVRVFSENPQQFVEVYSKEFHDAYMDVLRRKGLPLRCPLRHAAPRSGASCHDAPAPTRRAARRAQASMCGRRHGRCTTR